MTKSEGVNKKPITLRPIAVFESDDAKELRSNRESGWGFVFYGLLDLLTSIFKSLH